LTVEIKDTAAKPPSVFNIRCANPGQEIASQDYRMPGVERLLAATARRALGQSATLNDRVSLNARPAAVSPRSNKFKNEPTS